MVDTSKFRLTLSGAASLHHINRAVGRQDLDGDGKINEDAGEKRGDNFFPGGKFSFGAEGLIHLGNGAYFVFGGGIVAHFSENKIDSYTVPDGPLPDENLEQFTETEAAELQEQGSNVQAGDYKDESCFDGLIYICHPDGLYKQNATSHYIGPRLDLGVAGTLGQTPQGNPVLLGIGATVELRKFFLGASVPMVIRDVRGNQRFYGSQPLLWGMDVGVKIYLEFPVGKKFTISPYISANLGELEFFPEGSQYDRDSGKITSGEQQIEGGVRLAVDLF